MTDTPAAPVEQLPDVPSLGGLYARSLKAFLALPFGAPRARRRPDALPARSVAVADVEVRADHVADYARVCGFALADAVPLTYPHLLGFPLSVHLMVADDFPFALPGLVHVGQRIEQAAPVRIGDHLDVRVRTAELRPHRKGRQFDVIADIARDGETIWTGTSTYLRRGKDGAETGSDGTDGAVVAGGAAATGQRRDRDATPDAIPADPATSTWRLPKDLGKRYAAVSGDRNPIHLSPLTARLGGFKRPIAHGMWTAARAVAAVTDRITGPAELDVAFKRPVPLPSTVALRAARTDTGWRLDLHDRSGRRLHLTGSLAVPEDHR